MNRWTIRTAEIRQIEVRDDGTVGDFLDGGLNDIEPVYRRYLRDIGYPSSQCADQKTDVLPRAFVRAAVSTSVFAGVDV